MRVPAGTGVDVSIDLDGGSVGSVRIPPEQDDLELTIVVNSPLGTASNDDQRIGVVADVTLRDANGNEVTQFDTPLTICLAANQTTDNACLSYYDEKRQEWVCEDKCLREEGGFYCGDTSHLTSFALLLSGGGGNACEDPDYLYSWISLGFIIAALLIMCLAFVAIEISVRMRRIHRRKMIRSIAITVSDGDHMAEL